MSTQSENRVIEVNFGNKFFVDANQTPEKSGIYAICRGKQEKDEWRLSKLLYIGEANNINERLTSSHEKLLLCEDSASLHEEKLMFFIALVSNHENRELAEKVLILDKKPEFNDKIDRPVVGENVFIKTTSILGIPSVIKVPVHG